MSEQNAREWATQRMATIKAQMWDLQQEANGILTFLNLDNAEQQRQAFAAKQADSAAPQPQNEAAAPAQPASSEQGNGQAPAESAGNNSADQAQNA